MRWLHTLAHWLGYNTGQVVSKTDELGCVWVGFHCDQCGSVEGWHCVDKMIERELREHLRQEIHHLNECLREVTPLVLCANFAKERYPLAYNQCKAIRARRTANELR